MIKFTPNPKDLKPSRFKFIFDDSQVSFITANNYKEAAICIAANRIRAKKDFNIIGSWAQCGKQWDKINQESIVLKLN